MNQQPELNLTSFLLLIQSANTQKEKLEYIKQLVIYIKQTNKFKFQLDVDLGACVELWEQAGEGITKVQREIFGILNMIAEFGDLFLRLLHYHQSKRINLIIRKVNKMQVKQGISQFMLYKRFSFPVEKIQHKMLNVIFIGNDEQSGEEHKSMELAFAQPWNMLGCKF
ncbi:MAG: hypothetical protein EZS28_013873 [Streblomastix strix]|uniref:Uncharacterized protein n=1 Tax=Streblomastix strix TaxID=222440 RepID=A0A5J4W7Q3_9EUKA|nr:MAG: hypothetical protein EZS28_013873 [Streblomastix strix]